ncbi:MAG TPA: DNRLRE domain-containing protein [Gemmata sp.]|nr:DNRLRE domain-containing protein [Gemmata sp.]
MTTRLAALALAAAFAAAAPAGDPDRQTVTFQDGLNGYAGTVDLEIWAVAPNTCLNGNINASTDANNDGGESQVLMRFDDVFSGGEGRVPPKAAVHSATLVVSAFDEGTTVHLHRMLVPWKPTATWNSLVGGVTADGLEASKQKDGFTFGKISASTSAISFDVTDTVQAWANGAANHGWVFINTGGNGWDFYTSEFDGVKQRPKLVVEFSPPK